jgi:hypothetical protein
MRHAWDESLTRRPGRSRAKILLIAVLVLVLAGCSDEELTSSSPSDASSQPPSTQGIWAERAPLLDPNSEMAVAELDGRI